PKSTADEGRENTHFLFGHAKNLAKIALHILCSLCFVVNLQLTVLLIDDGGGEHLHGIMMLNGDTILGFEPHGGAAQRYFSLASGFWRSHAVSFFGFASVIAVRVQISRMGRTLVGDPH